MAKKIIYKNALFLLLFFICLVISSCLLFAFSDKQVFFTVNQHHTPFLDKLMTSLSAYGRGDTITIIFVLLLVFPLYRNKEYLFTTLSYGALVPVINHFSKDYFSKARPLGEFGLENVHTVPWLENLYFNSFPSGHTMGAFGFFLLLNYFIPQKKWYIPVFFFLLAAGCGYSRIYLGQHFLSDVIAGGITGTLISLLILLCVHLTLKRENNA